MSTNTNEQIKSVDKPREDDNSIDSTMIKNKLVGNIVKYTGLVLFISIASFGIFAFLSFNYEGLLSTTTITLIMISFTLIFKFDNPYLNSMLPLTFYGFFSLCMWLIPVITTVEMFVAGFLLHFGIALFNLFMILNKNIKCSKRAFYWGALFYMCWTWLYDDLYRLNVMTGVDNIFPSIATQIHTFYTLFLSLWIHIYIKKRQGALLP
jgi:hypothetical protein